MTYELAPNAAGGYIVYSDEPGRPGAKFATYAEAAYFAATGAIAPSAQDAERGLLSMSLGEKSPEEAVIAQVLALLPQARQLFGAALTLQIAWQDNDLNTTIAAAIASQQTVLGFDPAKLGTLGAMFNLLLVWINTPVAELGNLTPRKIIMSQYTTVE